MKKMRAWEEGNGAAINSIDCSKGIIFVDWNFSDAAVVIIDIPGGEKMSLLRVDNEMFHRKKNDYFNCLSYTIGY